MTIVSRKVDQAILIGGEIEVTPTDIDPALVRLLATGRIRGGPDDGAPFKKALDLAKGGEMRLGQDVVVTVVEILGDVVRLMIEAPGNVAVRRKEKQAWEEEAG